MEKYGVVTGEEDPPVEKTLDSLRDRQEKEDAARTRRGNVRGRPSPAKLPK